jgi:hypothetical protein
MTAVQGALGMGIACMSLFAGGGVLGAMFGRRLSGVLA